MAYTSPFTAVTGATITASSHNTSYRDNLNAIWVYTAAGSIAYSSGATTLAELVKPPVPSFLYNNNSGTVQWYDLTLMSGRMAALNQVSGVPNQDFSSTWADVTGAFFDLTILATSTVFLWASVAGYNNSGAAGRSFYVRGSIDGNVDANPGYQFNGSEATPRNSNLTYIWAKGSIPAGTRRVKLQCEGDAGTTNHVTSFDMFAMAFNT